MHLSNKHLEFSNSDIKIILISHPQKSQKQTCILDMYFKSKITTVQRFAILN